MEKPAPKRVRMSFSWLVATLFVAIAALAMGQITSSSSWIGFGVAVWIGVALSLGGQFVDSRIDWPKVRARVPAFLKGRPLRWLPTIVVVLIVALVVWLVDAVWHA